MALVGNPNTGKSTLFGALSGVRQRTGNYPGVTVEKKIGHATIESRRFEFIDLPGSYSLAPRSLDEMVAVEVLLGRQADSRPVDCVLSVVDASNLERNLYLVSQTLALGKPVVVALNMVDVAESRGVRVDVEKLSARLGTPVVAIQANSRRGLDALRQALLEAATQGKRPAACDPFPTAFRQEVDALERSLQTMPLGEAAAEFIQSNGDPANSKSDPALHGPLPRYLVERLLLDTSNYLQEHLVQWPARATHAAARCGAAALGGGRSASSGGRGHGPLRMAGFCARGRGDASLDCAA